MTDTPVDGIGTPIVVFSNGAADTPDASASSAQPKAVKKTPAALAVVNRRKALANWRAARDATVRDRAEDTIWTLDRAVSWFDDDSVVRVPVVARAAVSLQPPVDDAPSKSRSAASGGALREFRTEWAALWRHMSCYQVEGCHDLYLVWLFRSTADQALLWDAMHAPATVLNFFRQHRAELESSARPVYVEKLNGGPLGTYAGTLAASPRTIPGLFIQVYGHRNAVPCQHCEQNYRRYVRMDDHGEAIAHVMTPFFECVSLPGLNKSCCGNCLFRVDATGCSYHPNRRAELGAFTEALIASPAVESSLGPRKLNPESTPAVGIEMSAGLILPYTSVVKNRKWTGARELFGRARTWEGVSASGVYPARPPPRVRLAKKSPLAGIPEQESGSLGEQKDGAGDGVPSASASAGSPDAAVGGADLSSLGDVTMPDAAALVDD
ncbi:hypothetical protein F503_08646 [Ophiostoma piceae UAMH 11346]|uniref:Uncharacterized protein n=1 Tax=Ophiostoma piceae (strain UAMH 11346) TaxID=1262450 RepID=S3BRH8_OPHP1|nr:hypothetical protein F503_08646 [Ophiostoma piceae UAMH 11346]